MCVVSSPSGVEGGDPADHVIAHVELESLFGDRKCAVFDGFVKNGI